MRLLAILRQRCPRCLKGAVFASLWGMHSACPACGLRFEREQGYFVGAMYFSYGLSVVVAAPVAIAASAAGWQPFETGCAAAAAIALATPLNFRLSRVLWLHLDQRIDPR